MKKRKAEKRAQRKELKEQKASEQTAEGEDPDIAGISSSSGEVAWFENLAGDGSTWTEHVLITCTSVSSPASTMV